MAQNKTTQDERLPSVDQQTSSSGDNESKQISEISRNNQVDSSDTEHPIQPQTQEPIQLASQGSGKKSSAPRVKLDMDLDMELQLKAKIQGDLELAVLEN
ncbi:hypothetical protein ACHAPU_009406 [Fusarium lateritium]